MQPSLYLKEPNSRSHPLALQPPIRPWRLGQIPTSNRALCNCLQGGVTLASCSLVSRRTGGMEAWRWTVDKAENFHLGVSVPPQTLEHPFFTLPPEASDFGSDVNNFIKNISPRTTRPVTVPNLYQNQPNGRHRKIMQGCTVYVAGGGDSTARVVCRLQKHLNFKPLMHSSLL